MSSGLCSMRKNSCSITRHALVFCAWNLTVRTFFAVAIGVSLASVAPAADKVTYDDHVLPIFRNSCLNCHNPDKKKAGLDLSTYPGAVSYTHLRAHETS